MLTKPRPRRSILALVTAALVLPGAVLPATVPPTTRPEDVVADSLFDAGAYDSLLSFASQRVPLAEAQGDSVLLGRMIFVRGRARLALRLDGSREDFERARSIAVAVHDTLGWINALSLQSYVAHFEGRLDDCIRLNEQRLDLSIRTGNRRGEAWGHLLIALASLLQGDPDRALVEYDAAAAAFRDAGRPRDELRALIGRGRALDDLGRLDDAVAAYRLARERARELDDPAQEADAWNNIGAIAAERGALAVAASNFRRAYALKCATGEPDAPDVAASLADANTALGRYAAAESVLVDAVSRAREWRYDLVLASLMNQLGEIRLAQERPRAAATLFRRSLARGDITPERMRVDAVAGLARALAREDSVAAAVAVLDAGLAGLRASPPGASRARALTVWARCLRRGGLAERAQRIAAQAWDDAVARADTSAAILAAAERSECLRTAGEPARAALWFERARAMFRVASGRSREYQWREAQRAMLAPVLLSAARVRLEWPPDASTDARERSLFDLLQEIRARTLIERISDATRDARVAPALGEPLTSQDVQQHVLHDGECLLDLAVGTESIYVFAVTRDSLRLSVIDDSDGRLERRARRYVRLVGSRPHGAAVAGFAAAGAGLAAILDGCADLVSASDGLLIAADGWLASIPFAALPSPRDTTAALIDTHRIVAIPAASLARMLRGSPSPPAEGARVAAFAPAGLSLPGARREVDRLASRYASVVRLDSVPAGVFLAGDGASPDGIHIASHIRVDSERPWNSGIQTGPGEEPDAVLHASEIARERIGARVVVLSGCESALGRVTQGEGVLGLTAAFLCAGARSVVASLWAVDDRVTADLMDAFYAGLASGAGVGDALRSAQIAVRRGHPEPFYWAGFVVIGDDAATMPLRPASRSRILMIFLVFAAAVAAGLVGRHLRGSRAPPV